MSVTILPQAERSVQPKSEKIPDNYEDLIAQMHQFLDRLVAESSSRDLKDLKDVFIRSNSDA